MKKSILVLILVVGVIVVAAVIGIAFAVTKSDKDGSGSKVRFKVQNVEDGAKRRRDIYNDPRITPDYFGIKFVAAYVTEDIDPTTQNNVGLTQLIYLNPQCQENIRDCGVNPGNDSIIITDYFNFARPSAEVNADLGSQQRSVEPGTYKYVRLEFCKYGSGSNPNFSFRAGNMTSNWEFARPMCTITEEAVSPIVVNEGDEIIITLSYNLTDSVIIGSQPFGDPASTPTSPSYYLQVPRFVPTATVNNPI